MSSYHPASAGSSSMSSSTSSGSSSGGSIGNMANGSGITNAINGRGHVQLALNPAQNGYQHNPWANETAQLLHTVDSMYHPNGPAKWEDLGIQEGVHISSQARSPEAVQMTPVMRGATYIPDVTPVEVLACIHLTSFRLIWDTRIGSAGIIRRFSQHCLQFYIVWRGVSQLYKPRDATGVQATRFIGADGHEQSFASPDTQRIDIAWRSVDAADVPLQEDKIRAHVTIGAYRVEKAGDGCNVTFIAQVDLGEPIPGYLLRTLSLEQPRNVARLRGAIAHFGVPPYIVDTMECAVIQLQLFYPETRKTTLRAHVVRAGTFALVLDARRMYPSGIVIPTVTGDGAHALGLQESGDRLLISVAPGGVGREFYLEVEPRDKEPELDADNGWW